MKTSALPRFRALLLGSLLIAACSGSPKPAPGGGDGTGTGDGTVSDPGDGSTEHPGHHDPDAPGRGEPCGADDLCAEGLECVSYYGIAGPSGPEFKSCETRCASGKDAACPEGTTCTTIADGPGEVCR